MKIIKILLIVFISILIVGIVSTIIIVKCLSNRSLPDYNESIVMSGLKNAVTIYRDQYAVPHIYAENEDDLYRVTGFLMAQDRMWQMDVLRRATTGRLSEIFGEGLLDIDILFRSLRISDKSKQILDSTDKNTLNLLKSFADGVNFYLENNQNKLPPEFAILGYKPEKWEIFHSINLIGFISWDLSTAWSKEILLYRIKEKLSDNLFYSLIPNFENVKTNMFPEFKLDEKLIDAIVSLSKTNKKIENLGITAFEASNNWVISGQKSETKKPILANDMHLGLNSPGIWYQIHQVVEGKLNVTGVALPGQPTVICGHNDNIAWGMTNVMLDDIDFYIETINPENPNQYLFNGEWKDLIIKKEIINIKGKEPIEKTICFTHRGPIISELKGIESQQISMRWIGNEFSNEMQGVMQLNRAENWLDFINAVKKFVAVSQNIVFADSVNIGIFCAAGIPIRKGERSLVANGNTSECDWTGLVPFDSLPREFNPTRGFVSSANTKIADNNYPYFISNWYYQPYRLERINNMLLAKDKFCIEDFVKMQNDFTSVLPKKLLPSVLFECTKIQYENDLANQVIEILAKWDYNMHKNSIETGIFETFYINFAFNLIKDDLGEILAKELLSEKLIINNLIEYIWENKDSEWCDNINTKTEKETFSDVCQLSFLQTIEQLQEKLGNNIQNWQWGKLHTITFTHYLAKVKILDFLFGFNLGPYQVGGSHHTVLPFSYSFKTPYNANHGASHRHIFSTENWDASMTVIPTGNCGIPASKHYNDQTELYINGKYHPDYFSRNIIEKNHSYKAVIMP